MVSDATLERIAGEMRRRFHSPAGLLRALGMDTSLLEDKMKTNDRRRYGRDEETLDGEEQEKWFSLLADLDPEERDELFKEFEARARREEPDRYGEDRRRRGRMGRDEPPPFRGRPSTGGTPTAVPPDPEDRRQREGAEER